MTIPLHTYSDIILLNNGTIDDLIKKVDFINIQ